MMWLYEKNRYDEPFYYGPVYHDAHVVAYHRHMANMHLEVIRKHRKAFEYHTGAAHDLRMLGRVLDE